MQEIKEMEFWIFILTITAIAFIVYSGSSEPLLITTIFALLAFAVISAGKKFFNSAANKHSYISLTLSIAILIILSFYDMPEIQLLTLGAVLLAVLITHELHPTKDRFCDIYNASLTSVLLALIWPLMIFLLPSNSFAFNTLLIVLIGGSFVIYLLTILLMSSKGFAKEVLFRRIILFVLVAIICVGLLNFSLQEKFSYNNTAHLIDIEAPETSTGSSLVDYLALPTPAVNIEVNDWNERGSGTSWVRPHYNQIFAVIHNSLEEDRLEKYTEALRAQKQYQEGASTQFISEVRSAAQQCNFEESYIEVQLPWWDETKNADARTYLNNPIAKQFFDVAGMGVLTANIEDLSYAGSRIFQNRQIQALQSIMGDNESEQYIAARAFQETFQACS